MSIATRLVALATFVEKVESLGIHVIDAAAERRGHRLAFRGERFELDQILALTDATRSLPTLTGDVERPTLVADAEVDGVPVHLVAISVDSRPYVPVRLRARA